MKKTLYPFLILGLSTVGLLITYIGLCGERMFKCIRQLGVLILEWSLFKDI